MEYRAFGELLSLAQSVADPHRPNRIPFVQHRSMAYAAPQGRHLALGY